MRPLNAFSPLLSPLPRVIITGKAAYYTQPFPVIHFGALRGTTRVVRGAHYGGACSSNSALDWHKKLHFVARYE